MSRVVHGALIGSAAGLVAGLVGELAVFLTRTLFPTDVAIVGFALIWAMPAGLLVGTVCGWRGWLTNPRQLALAAAIPGLVVGVLASLIQLSAV